MCYKGESNSKDNNLYINVVNQLKATFTRQAVCGMRIAEK